MTILAEETKQEAESVTHLSHSMGGRIARERPRKNKNATRIPTVVRGVTGECVCKRLYEDCMICLVEGSKAGVRYEIIDNLAAPVSFGNTPNRLNFKGGLFPSIFFN